jgi:hypothetical protein
MEYKVNSPEVIIGPLNIVAGWFRASEEVPATVFVYDDKIWIEVPEKELNQPYANDPNFTRSDTEGNKYTWNHLRNDNSMKQRIFRKFVAKMPEEAEKVLTRIK